MGIKAKDLNPVPSTFMLKDKEYTLRAFDLAAEVWAYAKFGTKEQPNGLLALGNAMKDMDTGVGPAMELAYHLLQGPDFPTFKEFYKAIDNDGKYKKVIEVYQALVVSIGLSQQQVDDMEGDEELKKPLRVTMK